MVAFRRLPQGALGAGLQSLWDPARPAGRVVLRWNITYGGHQQILVPESEQIHIHPSTSDARWQGGEGRDD